MRGGSDFFAVLCLSLPRLSRNGTSAVNTFHPPPRSSSASSLVVPLGGSADCPPDVSAGRAGRLVLSRG
ncbi:Hypothetical protein NTJ_02889 [Nesidiocoris tenuis]|uniref:Secreted protein n=1 Tax=Nesidiocoris tenuis TaxID=355587 RepID=A0ABN7ACQ9_9HEMI|nr:Hypothetical protein NTJ_02889 [Nesidiocoris tenuis]